MSKIKDTVQQAARNVHSWIPNPLQKFMLRLIGWNRREGPWNSRSDIPERSLPEGGAASPWRLGILKEFYNLHVNYIRACQEMRVEYRVIDIANADWMERVKESRCHAFLTRPSPMKTIWKQMYDDRIRIMAEEMGLLVYPSEKSTWIYESKRRMAYWLEAHEIPHPKTWVFYRQIDAMNFANDADLPIVVKTDLGCAASGVRIVRSRKELKKIVKKYFIRGIRRQGGDDRDIQWGNIILQQYISNAKEWRVIRLGDSYFAHQKMKKGDFHSGSKEVGWFTPPHKLLDFVREITDIGHFSSMNVDLFESDDGAYYVNELQTLFGSYLPYQMRVNDVPGRFVWKGKGEWSFEEGEFNKNGSCNLRVEVLLKILDETATQANAGQAAEQRKQ